MHTGVELALRNKSRAKRFGRVGFVALAALSLSACLGPTAGLNRQRVAAGEVAIPMGTPVRDNRSPMEAALACFGAQLTGHEAPRLVIAVGDVKDYTGKYSINEGSAITQGGSLMVYSALGKIGAPIAIAERFDPTIAERELGYTDRRQLGDGNVHEMNGSAVPWLPYFGGTITSSDYYIVGGITELNYNIQSSGGEVRIGNVGPKARVFTQSVAVDLRIVDSRSLIVLKTISLTKQFSGYEIGANMFRFFGTELFDINIGAEGQEPLQLGIRTALEEATLRLVAAVQQVDPARCMTQRLGTISELTAEEFQRSGLFASSAPSGALQPAPRQTVASSTNLDEALNSQDSATSSATGELLQVGFEFADTALTGGAQSVLDQIAQRASEGPINVMVVARDTENWEPAMRDSLLDQRLTALISALANRGVPPAGISVTWRPDRSDTSIHRDGPGLQEIARIQVRR